MDNEFDLWMDNVDTLLCERTGFTSGQFPDQSYWDMWEKGLSPQQMVDHAINNEWNIFRN